MPCTEMAQTIKVVASATTAITAVLGTILAWKKVNQIFGLRQADLDLRRAELVKTPPTS